MDKKKILVVEDEEIIRKLCKRLLSKLGHEVSAVGTLKEAEKKVEEIEWDLLISDLKLPDGSGVDMIRFFKKRFPQKKALIITGSLTPDRCSEPVGDIGVIDCIAKPFDIDQFISAVKKALPTQNQKTVRGIKQ